MFMAASVAVIAEVIDSEYDAWTRAINMRSDRRDQRLLDQSILPDVAIRIWMSTLSDPMSIVSKITKTTEPLRPANRLGCEFGPIDPPIPVRLEVREDLFLPRLVRQVGQGSIPSVAPTGLAPARSCE